MNKIGSLFIAFILIILSNCKNNFIVEEINFKNKEQKRTCFVEIQKNNVTEIKSPLLIILHGNNESGKFINYRTKNNGMFVQKGMVTAYPDGSGVFRHNWTDFDNEISFLNILIDTLINHFIIDTTRIYIAGFSQGSDIAYKMACKYPNRIAAIATVAASMDSEYIQKNYVINKAIPLISFNSIADPACLYDSFTYKGKWYNSVETGIKTWAVKIGCSYEPDTIIRQSSVIIKKWTNHKGIETVLFLTEKGGHAWPGGRGIFYIPHFEPSNCINANKIIYEFFTRYSIRKI